MLSKLLELYKKGEYNLLLQHFASLDKKNIKNAKIENLRGLVNFSIGNSKEAIRLFEYSICLQKNYIDPYINLGTYYFSKKNFQKAEEFLLQALAINNSNPVVLNYLGMIEVLKKKLDKAEQYFKDCINYNPKYFLGLLNLGNLFYQQKNYKEAISYYLKSIDIVNNYDALKNLGYCYFDLSDLKKSNIYLKKALSLKTNSDLLFQISYNYKAMGNLPKSEEYLRQSFQENSKHSKTIFALSKLKNSNILNIEELKINFEKEINKLSKAEIGFSLFNLLNKKKYFKDAAYYLDSANDLISEMINDNIYDEQKEFDFYKRFFNKNFFNNLNNKDIAKHSPVVFIVGMPRSGSTLVEQIISSHSEVASLGETDRLYKSISDNYDNLDLDMFEQSVEKSNLSKFQKIMNDYLSKLPCNNGTKKFFTDKMLNNFRFIGFIKTGLPDAKIVYCRRDPRDNCFSIYSNYFGTQKNSWIYNKEQLINFYLLQEQLMNHWIDIFKVDIYSLQYENLVKNFESEIRDLLNFLKLKWEPQCLNFENNSNVVLTASSLQVRQKLYASSIGQWQDYKNIYKDFFKRLN